MEDIQDVYEYVMTNALASFEYDIDFQRGHQTALEDVLREGFETEVPVLRTVH